MRAFLLFVRLVAGSTACAVTGTEIDAAAVRVSFSCADARSFAKDYLLEACAEARTANGQRLVEMPLEGPEGAARLEDGQLLYSFGDVQCTFSAARLLSRAAPEEGKLWGAGLGTFLRFLPTRYSAAFEGGRLELGSLLQGLAVRGFALVEDAGLEPLKVEQIGDAIGFVRKTNYGRSFDVRSIANANNLAYTSRAVSPHLDNPYRDPVPGIQLLHCLENEAEGGDTILVDGFAAAELLREENPGAFDLLVSTARDFRFADDGVDLRATTPVIQVVGGRVVRVAVNSRSVEPLEGGTVEYYAAYRAFLRLLHGPKFRVTFRLRPGDVLIFDNRRVLHGRTEFNGARHLKGAYVDIDGALSLHRTMPRQEPEAFLQRAAQEIFGMLEHGKDVTYGEGCSMWSHQLQTAHIARASGEDDETVLGAVLHDIGHHEEVSRLLGRELKLAFSGSLGHIGMDDHDELGGAFLTSLGFSERVAAVVRGHVAAKRYLVATNQTYHKCLTEASIETLKRQGGSMSEVEAKEFEGQPDMARLLRVRNYEEAGKKADAEPEEELDQHLLLELMIAHLDTRAAAVSMS